MGGNVTVFGMRTRAGTSESVVWITRGSVCERLQSSEGAEAAFDECAVVQPAQHHKAVRILPNRSVRVMVKLQRLEWVDRVPGATLDYGDAVRPDGWIGIVAVKRVRD